MENVKIVVESDPVATIVSTVCGVVSGTCATTLTLDIIDKISPASSSILKGITYGIGSVAIGGLVGTKVKHYVREEVFDASNGILEVKASIKRQVENFKTE